MDDLEKKLNEVQDLIEREHDFNSDIDRNIVIEQLKISALMCLVNELKNIIDWLECMNDTIRYHE